MNQKNLILWIRKYSTTSVSVCLSVAAIMFALWVVTSVVYASRLYPDFGVVPLENAGCKFACELNTCFAIPGWKWCLLLIKKNCFAKEQILVTDTQNYIQHLSLSILQICCQIYLTFSLRSMMLNYQSSIRVWRQLYRPPSDCWRLYVEVTRWYRVVSLINSTSCWGWREQSLRWQRLFLRWLFGTHFILLCLCWCNVLQSQKAVIGNVIVLCLNCRKIAHSNLSSIIFI